MKGEALNIFLDEVLYCWNKSVKSFKYQKGQTHTLTDWYTKVLWRILAEFVDKYFLKMSTVYIEGNNKTRVFEDKQGIKRYVTEIVGEQVLLQKKKSRRVALILYCL